MRQEQLSFTIGHAMIESILDGDHLYTKVNTSCSALPGSCLLSPSTSAHEMLASPPPTQIHAVVPDPPKSLYLWYIKQESSPSPFSMPLNCLAFKLQNYL